MYQLLTDGWTVGWTTEMASAPYYKLPPQFEEEAKNEILVIFEPPYSYLSNNRRGTISFFGFLQPSTPVFAGGTFSFFSDLQPGTLI